MVKMMQPYFSKLDDGDQQMAQQIQALFPEGFDAHLAHQVDTAFDFTAVFEAIRIATDSDVTNALNLSDAEFKQSDSARSKSDHDLTLVESMNRFREQFSQKALSEQIYNPQHLLKALQLYD